MNRAYLEYSRAGFWRWVVPKCAFCGRVHVHGGGELASDPRRSLGHRSAYCSASGYRIVDDNPEHTTRFIRETLQCSTSQVA